MVRPLLALLAALVALPADAQTYAPAPPPPLAPAPAASPTRPDKFPIPAPELKERRANTMMDPITPQARMKFIQSSLALSPFSVRDLINLMAYKTPVKPGVDYDDVVAAMKQRANKINFKFVGVNAL
ncbi:MAG: hypothetical protein HZY79_02005 [Rhodoblastus sp.]|nr:MAG: hypothetical protein HZY79_02005 [Rhodoblastus sp.]